MLVDGLNCSGRMIVIVIAMIVVIVMIVMVVMVGAMVIMMMNIRPYLQVGETDYNCLSSISTALKTALGGWSIRKQQ